MKHLIAFIFFIAALLGCQKDNVNSIDKVDPSNAENILLNIESIDFHNSPNASIDSVLSVLDTFTYINNTTIQQAEFSYEPYKNVHDTLFIEFDDFDKEKVKLKDSFLLPDIKINNQFLFTQKDSIFLKECTETFSFPANKRIRLTQTIKPTPKTKYEVSGEYWTVKFASNFTATVRKSDEKESFKIKGKIWGSKIAVGFFDGQDSKASLVTINVSEIK